MPSTYITFRGEEDVEVKYTDHGYEHDTGAHDCDWEFTNPKLNDIELTDEEEQEIYLACLQASAERDYGGDY
jgi:hypothetical protein